VKYLINLMVSELGEQVAGISDEVAGTWSSLVVPEPIDRFVPPTIMKAACAG
jgi:hypothetical protein